jgi:ABC-type polysaccharide/polyol phosphate transport system ATPase subunit
MRVSNAQLPPGAIRAAQLGRQFEIVTAEPRSLKDVLLRHRRPTRRPFWALRGVDLVVEPGRTFGIIGRNGSGKSTLLSLMARIFPPSEGSVAVGGRIGSLLDVGAGFHPEFTGVENVYLSAAIHGLGRTFVRQELDDIIGFADLEEFAHMPVKTYSSGMFLRLGFSVAMAVRPDVLLVDEVLAVGDEAFQRRCYERIAAFKGNGGTLVFVSHDPSAVANLCDEAILLEQGRVRARGPVNDVLDYYHRRLFAETGAAEADAELA